MEHKHATFFQKAIIITEIIVCVIGLVTALVVGWAYFKDIHETQDKVLANVQQQITGVTGKIDEEMTGQMVVAQDVADKLSSGELAYTDAEAYVKTVFENTPGALGMAVAFEPYVYSPDQRLFGSYALRDASGGVQTIYLHTKYDYTDPKIDTAQWYHSVIGGNTGKWVGAYYGQASDDLLIVYATPFKSPKTGKNDGVIVISDSATNTFKKLIQNTDLGENGYVFLVNDRNQVAFHPDTQMIGKDVASLVDQLKVPGLAEGIQNAQQGNESRIEGKINTSAQTNGWYFLHPLGVSGWTAVISVDQNIVLNNPEKNIRWLINIFLTICLFCLPLSMLVFRVEKATTFGLMGFSVSLGFLFLFGILWVWYAVYTNPVLNHQKVLVDYTDINRNLTDMVEKLNGAKAKMPQQIPTGIMIENMTMGNQSVKVSGYIWQKYPAGFPEEMIGMPQLTDRYGGTAEKEIYRTVKDNETLVGWFFTTEIQQHFDVRSYPLDQAIVKIQIEPAKLSEQYMLVPDIEDYDYLGPAYMPGISSELIVRGWELRNSFYKFEQEEYSTTFGLFEKFQKDFVPNLTFNIRMTRDIVSPVVAYCIVIYVVIIQVYGITILKIGDPFNVLSISAALFLVVAVTHNNLRDTLAANGVVYLEYFFILLYITILAASVNAFMRAAKIELPIVSYRDNLLFKIMFWPTFLGIGLILTLIIFYPRIGTP